MSASSPPPPAPESHSEHTAAAVPPQTAALPGRGGRASGMFALFYGLFAGSTAWSLHLLFSYLVKSTGCDNRAPHLDLWLNLLTVIALVATVAALFISWRTWRHSGIAEETATGGPGGRSGFLGLAGLVLGGAFLIAIIFGELPVLFLPACS